MKTKVTCTLAGLLLLAPAMTWGQQAGVAQDNTKVNKRDRKSGAATAGEQKENESDRQTTANIRKALMDDKSLSTYAHNVKIVTHNGAVTLKGPVRTVEEKNAIEAKATEIAGAGKVHNLISVKPKS